ncbi:MAG: C_GCAxxG_C_C family protein [Clostridia bacterium]|jgi:hypothetical protein|nr:C_GCAxxG_C_C family protein [Clostridia bacterium]
MERAEKAVNFKHNGNNCCQAVMMAYADRMDITELQIKRLGATFGAGMGCFESTCGSLCGAQMVLGMTGGSMRTAKLLVEGFRSRAGGSTICRELKGIETGNMLCTCDDCVRYASECLENLIGK